MITQDLTRNFFLKLLYSNNDISEHHGQDIDLSTELKKYKGGLYINYIAGDDEDTTKPMRYAFNDNKDKKNILMFAIRKRFAKLVKVILEDYRDSIEINYQDSLNNTALILALDKNKNYVNAETVELLIEHNKIDLNLTDKEGRTALIHAAIRGHIESAKYLIKQQDRIDFNIECEIISYSGLYYAPALPLAAMNGHIEIVKEFLRPEFKGKINFNSDNKCGFQSLKYTALNATTRSHEDVFNELLQHKEIRQDINHKDVFNKTVLDYAKENENNEIISMVKDAMN